MALNRKNISSVWIKQRGFRYSIVAVALGALGLGVGTSCFSLATSAIEPEEGLKLQGQVQVHGLEAPAQPLGRTGNLGRLCRWKPGTLGMDVISNETDPASGALMRWSSGHSVSFGIEAVSARHADDFFVMGRDRTNSLVLERWTFQPVVGGYGTTRPEAGTPIGVPAALSQSSAYINGPVFLTLSERSRVAPPVRTELARLPAMPDLLSMEVDPEGRFLLLLTRTLEGVVELHQLALEPQAGTPQLIASSLHYAELTDAEHINVIERPNYGRAYFVGRVIILPCLVLQDLANSGVFDSLTGMSSSEFRTTYMNSLWSNPFF